MIRTNMLRALFVTVVLTALAMAQAAAMQICIDCGNAGARCVPGEAPGIQTVVHVPCHGGPYFLP